MTVVKDQTKLDVWGEFEFALAHLPFPGWQDPDPFNTLPMYGILKLLSTVKRTSLGFYNLNQGLPTQRSQSQSATRSRHYSEKMIACGQRFKDARPHEGREGGLLDS